MSLRVRQPELELLIVCARKELTKQDCLRAEEILSAGIDWDFMLKTAACHGIIPFLYHHLLVKRSIRVELIPQDAYGMLQRTGAKLTRRILESVGCLITTIELLEKSRISVIPFKGPLLSQDIYGQIAMRHFSDLDLLVPEESLENVERVLVANGYRVAEFRGSPQLRRIRKARSKDLCFLSPDNIRIEVHRRLTKLDAPVQISYSNVVDTCIETRIGARAVISLGLDDLLIYLCIHGTSHMWTRLEWVATVAEIVRQGRVSSWEAVLKKAGRLESELAVVSGLYLARTLFPDIYLPFQVSDTIQGRATRLASSVIDRIFESVPDNVRGRQILEYRIKTRSRFSGKIRQVWYFATDVKAEEVEMLNLPSVLFPVYYVFRTGRLAWKFALARLR